jgi:hypothetical protein
MEAPFRFRCSCCGDWHEGLPDLAYRAPDCWDETKAAADPENNKLDSDFCMIGAKHFFVRSVLLVPIADSSAVLGWGVWVTQSATNFRLYMETYDATPERVTFGYLANRLPDYGDTLNMRAHVHWRTGNQRPWVELAPCDHALYQDWSKGVAREKAIVLAEKSLHSTG